MAYRYVNRPPCQFVVSQVRLELDFSILLAVKSSGKTSSASVDGTDAIFQFRLEKMTVHELIGSWVLKFECWPGLKKNGPPKRAENARERIFNIT